MITGDGLKTAALVIIGNIFIVLLAAKALTYWAQERFGLLISCIAGAVVIAGFVWFPDQTKTILSSWWGSLTGTKAA